MNTLLDKIADATAVNVWFDNEKIYIQLTDGRELGAPIDWFLRLRDCSEAERNNIGRGTGVHWEDIDEDLSVAGLLRTK